MPFGVGQLRMQIAPVARIIHEHHRGNGEATEGVERGQAHGCIAHCCYFFPNSGSIFTRAAMMKAGMVDRHAQTKKFL
ncbi:hypothetical protein D9M68_906240 [compost metagenome]